MFVVQQIDRYKTKRLINGKGKRENYRLVGILGVSNLDITWWFRFRFEETKFKTTGQV